MSADADAFASNISPLTPLAADAAVTPVTGPQIVRVTLLGHPVNASSVRIQFSEPLNPGRAENKENYRIGGQFFERDDDGELYTQDDGNFHAYDRRRVFFDRIVYNDDARTVTLFAEHDFSTYRAFRLLRVRSGASGIHGATGAALDGDRDGQAGGLAVHRFRMNLGRQVRYHDLDGDLVKLKITRSGWIAVLEERNADRRVRGGEAVQVWLFGKVQPYSVLKGTVTPTTRGGDGQARIDELVQTGPASLQILDDPHFTILT